MFSQQAYTHRDLRFLELNPTLPPWILKLIKNLLSDDYAKSRFFRDTRVEQRWKTRKETLKGKPHVPHCKMENRVAWGRQGVGGYDSLDRDGATMFNGQAATPGR